MLAPKTRLNSQKNQPRRMSSSQVSGSRCAPRGFQQDGGQGRAERQRIEGGDHRGNGDGDGELAEELARDPAQEGGRHEDREEHQGHGDHRPGHFVHGLVRRLAGRDALFQPALDVLDHHDGVVHDDADRQHQAEEREVIERDSPARP